MQSLISCKVSYSHESAAASRVVETVQPGQNILLGEYIDWNARYQAGSLQPCTSPALSHGQRFHGQLRTGAFDLPVARHLDTPPFVGLLPYLAVKRDERAAT